MKTIKTLLFALALVLTSVVSNAQFHVGAGLGYSTLKTMTGDLTIGYEYATIDLSAGFISHFSPTVGKGTIFNAKVGKTVTINELWSIQPAMGGSFFMQSADDKTLNTGGMLYSLYAYKSMYNFPEAQIQFGVVYAQKTTIVSVGLRFRAVN